MSSSSFFCATLSRGQGEHIYGTVARIDSWLLIEYPAAWRSRALAASTLPAAVKLHLDPLAQRFPGQRRLLIRQGHRRASPVRCFLAESAEVNPRLLAFEVNDYDELADPEPALSAARPVAEPVVLVCTHGTHDKCCAKFGRPVYESLRGRAPERVWECTHVGGDRFAANVVCLPHGIYYGHVEPDEAPLILETLARGELWLDKYRGRCCYPRPAQVAEYFLRRETVSTGIDDLRLLAIERTEPGRWIVRFELYGMAMCEIEFRVASNLLYQPLTCKSDAAGAIRQYELIRFTSSVAGTRTASD